MPSFRPILTIRRAALLSALAVSLVLPGAAIAQTRGGTLTAIVQPEPPILMLGLNQQGPTQYVAGKIYQGLLTYDENLKPLPSLAKAWKVSPDGLTYTFELQTGVKWHDGKPFSSEDVVFSMDKFLRAVHPRARLIYEGTDFATNPANQTPIGTGPFKFKEWKKGSYVILTRNNDYWKPNLPYLDEIIFKVIPDAASRAVAFEKSDVNVLRGGDVDNVEVKRLRALPNVEMTTKGWEMYAPLAFMVMNQRQPPFDNVKVRQAVMHAVNRKFVVDNIFFGLGKVAISPLASSTLFFEPKVTQYDFNMKKARDLIKESGVNVGARTIRLLSFPYGSAWDRLGEYTKQSLEQLGFKVDIVSVDAGGWAKSTGDFDFDLTFNFTYQYGDPAIGVARHYLSSNIVKGSPFVNNQGYSNPKVDELLSKGASTIDPIRRQQLYSEAQNILVNEVANGFLFEIEYPTFYRKNVRNLVTTAIGLNESFDNVWIEK